MPARLQLSLDQARDAILAAPAPVLMGDTCGLLDIIRAPLRPKSGGLQPAIELIDLVERNPREIHVVVASRVVEEWNRHREDTCKLLRDRIDETRHQVAALRVACQAMGFSPPDELSSAVDLLKESLPRLADRLFEAAIVLAPDNLCEALATTRSGLWRPPAERGGPPHDCVVMEHCRGLAMKLQEAGHLEPRVFVSSNTKDYCVQGRLHPKLTEYFVPVGLEFCPNLAAARGRLFPGK